MVRQSRAHLFPCSSSRCSTTRTKLESPSSKPRSPPRPHLPSPSNRQQKRSIQATTVLGPPSCPSTSEPTPLPPLQEDLGRLEQQPSPFIPATSMTLPQPPAISVVWSPPPPTARRDPIRGRCPCSPVLRRTSSNPPLVRAPSRVPSSGPPFLHQQPLLHHHLHCR